MQTASNDAPARDLDAHRREVALFRYGVIADLVHLPANHRGLYALLKKKAELDHTIPGSLRRHVAAETMRGWLRDYRRGGFDALAPRVRKDHGNARAIPSLVVDLLCQLKDDTPSLSIPALLKLARAEHADLVTDEVKLPESTVHRLLARRGLMKKKPDEPTTKDRRRFEHESAGDLWMSDVMYGPKLREGGRLRQTYLIALIDDATRLVPHAAFTLSEGAVSYLQGTHPPDRTRRRILSDGRMMCVRRVRGGRFGRSDQPEGPADRALFHAAGNIAGTSRARTTPSRASRGRTSARYSTGFTSARWQLPRIE